MAITADRETLQTILDLINPLHGAIDKQTYDERYHAGFDAPADAEYPVNVSAGQERNLTQAVLILENRLSSDQPDEILMPVTDANNLDEVVRELGIEDSHITPAEAVRELKADRDAARRDIAMHSHVFKLSYDVREALGFNKYYPLSNQADDVRAVVLERDSLLAIARRWAAIDGGAWNVERSARDRAELLADTRAAITKAYRADSPTGAD